jgi:cytochrome c-type biogenesis protein CcmH/NrfF
VDTWLTNAVELAGWLLFAALVVGGVWLWARLRWRRRVAGHRRRLLAEEQARREIARMYRGR